MKKGIFIVAGLLLVGGLGFLYMKNKNKALLPSDTAETPATTPTTVNPTTGAVVPKVDEVLPVSSSTKNAQEAVNVASQIFDLKNKKTKYSIMSISEFSKTKEGREDFFINNNAMLKALKENVLKSINSQLNILNDRIVALGYVEVNGSIAKLNL